MSFVRPTQSALIGQARDDFAARLPGADSRLPASVVDVLARVGAAGLGGLYGYLDWLSRQLHEDTADGDILARKASIWGVNRKAAVPAGGTVMVTGTTGTAVPLGSELARGDALRVRTLAAVTLGMGPTAVLVEAVDGGVIGNSAAATALTFIAPIAGVNAIAAVDGSGLVGGGEEESDEALRARLLARIRAPAHGGSRSDYERWALEVAEVTRVWVYPDWMGAGSVGVTFVCDGRVNILPQPADLDMVAAWLDPLRPVTATPVVFAPTPFEVDLSIRIVPDGPAVRAAITLELDDFFARDAEPGGTIHVSRLREAISIAAGESWHDLELPSQSFHAAPGVIPVLGDITWL